MASEVFIDFGAAVQISHGSVLPELVPDKTLGLVVAFVLAINIPGTIAKAFISETKIG